MLQPATVTYADQEDRVCAACGVPLHAAETHYGHPFISARQLVMMVFHTAIRSPQLFGEIMLQELPPVPYCTACRQQLPAKRQAEQLKLIMGVLLLFALVAGTLITTVFLAR